MSDPSFWNGRRVLVTGCGGFTGSWLSRGLIEAGATVTGIVRDRPRESVLTSSGMIEQMELVVGDVRDLDGLVRTIDERKIESVFHLAAQAIVTKVKDDMLGTFEINVRGTWNLLEACRRNDSVRRVLVASSDKAYGKHDRLPYEETFPLQGRHPYDVSKGCADRIARTFAHSFGVPVGVTRCANLYGAGDLNWNRIVPGTIQAALAGERPVIRSDGTPVRDYMWVGDAVRAYLALAPALDDPALHGEAFNFGTGEPVSVLEMTRRVLHAAGRDDLQPDVQGRAGGDEIPRQYLSSEKAHKHLGWRAERSLDDALVETIDWYRDHLAS